MFANIVDILGIFVYFFKLCKRISLDKIKKGKTGTCIDAANRESLIKKFMFILIPGI